MLAVVAAGAMTMGMAMPTFAADGGKTTEAWITKTYYTEVGKAEKFSFTAEQVKTGTGIITTDAAVTMPEISFTDTETGTISKRGQITFPTYPEAGKYEYTVTETQTADPIVANSEHEKMIMSQAEYTMDVYVTDGATGTEISNIVVNKVKDDAGQTATGKVDVKHFKEGETLEKLKQNPIVKKLGLNRILLVCILIVMFAVFKVVLGK